MPVGAPPLRVELAEVGLRSAGTGPYVSEGGLLPLPHCSGPADMQSEMECDDRTVHCSASICHHDCRRPGPRANGRCGERALLPLSALPGLDSERGELDRPLLGIIYSEARSIRELPRHRKGRLDVEVLLLGERHAACLLV